jgi:hypothetical protein
MKQCGSKRLALISPTRYYGYAAKGEAAPPEVSSKSLF